MLVAKHTLMERKGDELRNEKGESGKESYAGNFLGRRFRGHTVCEKQIEKRKKKGLCYDSYGGIARPLRGTLPQNSSVKKESKTFRIHEKKWGVPTRERPDLLHCV